MSGVPPCRCHLRKRRSSSPSGRSRIMVTQSASRKSPMRAQAFIVGGVSRVHRPDERSGDLRQHLLESQPLGQLGGTDALLAEQAGQTHQRHTHHGQVHLHGEQRFERRQGVERLVPSRHRDARDHCRDQHAGADATDAESDGSPEEQRQQQHGRRAGAGNRRCHEQISEHQRRDQGKPADQRDRLDEPAGARPFVPAERRKPKNDGRHDAQLGERVGEDASPPHLPVRFAAQRRHDGGISAR